MSKNWLEQGEGAFPIPATEENNTHWGMSLRDWFAGQALSGIASYGGGASREGCETKAQADARWSYQRADAMLAACNA